MEPSEPLQLERGRRSVLYKNREQIVRPRAPAATGLPLGQSGPKPPAARAASAPADDGDRTPRAGQAGAEA
jgi:hypothetical protein